MLWYFADRVKCVSSIATPRFWKFFTILRNSCLMSFSWLLVGVEIFSKMLLPVNKATLQEPLMSVWQRFYCYIFLLLTWISNNNTCFVFVQFDRMSSIRYSSRRARTLESIASLYDVCNLSLNPINIWPWLYNCLLRRMTPETRLRRVNASSNCMHRTTTWLWLTRTLTPLFAALLKLSTLYPPTISGSRSLGSTNSIHPINPRCDSLGKSCPFLIFVSDNLRDFILFHLFVQAKWICSQIRIIIKNCNSWHSRKHKSGVDRNK